MSDDEDTMAIIDLGTLLVIMLAQPDAETALDGMRRVAMAIVDRTRSIRRRAYPDDPGDSY